MENHFGEEIAKTYDAELATPEAAKELAQTIDVLASLAEGGPVLEFAIGTGRVAIPLAATGVPVSGVELSDAMLDVMRAKPGAGIIDAVQGDMVTTRLTGEFTLVFLVFNTIGNLTDQAAQVACFENAARHLAPGGRFVIENMIPPLRRFPPGAAGVAFEVSEAHTGVDTIDTATQSIVSHHYVRQPDGSIRYNAVPQRYTWPAELDMMARIAGLVPENRWGGWDKRPFDAECDKHISVWRKPK